MSSLTVRSVFRLTSLYPLLKKDGLDLQYFVVTFLWNYLLGSFTFTSNPFKAPASLLKYVQLVSRFPPFFISLFPLPSSSPLH